MGGAAFFAGAFFAGDFFAATFFAGAFFAVVFFAGAFFAADFVAATFFAGAFVAVDRAVDLVAVFFAGALVAALVVDFRATFFAATFFAPAFAAPFVLGFVPVAADERRTGAEARLAAVRAAASTVRTGLRRAASPGARASLPVLCCAISAPLLATNCDITPARRRSSAAGCAEG